MRLVGGGRGSHASRTNSSVSSMPEALSGRVCNLADEVHGGRQRSTVGCGVYSGAFYQRYRCPRAERRCGARSAAVRCDGMVSVCREQNGASEAVETQVEQRWRVLIVE